MVQTRSNKILRLRRVRLRSGLGAVELSANRALTGSASDALSTDPQKLKKIFDDAQIKIGGIHIGSDLAELPERIVLAGMLEAPELICDADAIFTRSGIADSRTVDYLERCGDSAASAGISILIQNQATHGSALRLWHLLDRLNHPSIGCCWDTYAAAQAGDEPAVAVPLLNSRIMGVFLQDALRESPAEPGRVAPEFRAQGTTGPARPGSVGDRRGTILVPVALGTGELPLRITMDRLRGIGFDGSVGMGLPRLQQGDAESLRLALQASVAVLEQWIPVARELKK